MGEFDKITIDGKSVEEYLLEHKEIPKPDKHYPKRKGRVKHMEHKEPHGQVKVSTQAALNKNNLENNLLNAKNSLEKTVYHLNAGEILNSTNMVEKGIGKHPTSCAGILRRIRRSYLGQYIKTSHKIHKQTVSHWLNEEGQNLKPAEAIAYVNTPKADFTPHKFSEIPVTNNTVEKDVVVNVTVKLKLEVI